MQTQTIRQMLQGIAIACLFATLVTPLLILPQAPFPFVTGKTLWFRLCLQLGAVFWLLATLAGDRSSMPGRLALALGSLILVHGAADLLAPDSYRALFGTVERQDGFIGLFYFALHAAMACCLLTGRWLRRYLAAMVAVSVLVAASGLYTAWHWWPHRYGGGTLGNPSYLGIYCAMHAVLAWWLAERRHPAWFLAGAVNAAAVLATQSRGAMLALGVAYIVAEWRDFGRGARWGAMLIGAAALCGLYVYGMDNERWRVWDIALEAFHARPWLGFGHEHFEPIWSVLGKDLPAGTRAYDRAHNWFLDRLVDGGVLGLAAWCWLLYEIGRLAQKAPDRGLMYGCLAAYLVGGFFLFDVLATTAALSGLIALASVGGDVHRDAVLVLDRQPLLDGR